MNIHHKLIKYHKFGSIADICIGMSKKECDLFVSCGYKKSCLKYGTVPCPLCKIWEGYCMEESEIKNMAKTLKSICKDLKK